MQESLCCESIWVTNSMEAQETFVDGRGKNHTESQFFNKMQSAGCRLCRIAREARGESTDGLAAETHGHINSG